VFCHSQTDHVFKQVVLSDLHTLYLNLYLFPKCLVYGSVVCRSCCEYGKYQLSCDDSFEINLLMNLAPLLLVYWLSDKNNYRHTPYRSKFTASSHSFPCNSM